MEEKRKNVIKIVCIILAIISIIALVLVWKNINDSRKRDIEQANSQFNSSMEEISRYEGVQIGSTVQQMLDKIIEHNKLDIIQTTQFIKVMDGDASSETSNGADEYAVADIWNEEISAQKEKINEAGTYIITIGRNKTTKDIVAVGILDITSNDENKEDNKKDE